MAMTFHVDVVSAEEELFSGTAEMLFAPGAMGELGIMARHTPLLTPLKPGELRIKLEGGEEVIESVKRILTAGIPVMGHLGLTPQSIFKFGTYSVRAKEEAEAEKLKEDIQLLEEAGCFSVVLEKIPANLASEVVKLVDIPLIGIGAGGDVDGQVLVLHDLLGLTHEFHPRFLRRYLNLYEDIKGAVENYITDVKSRDFPNDSEQY